MRALNEIELTQVNGGYGSCTRYVPKSCEKEPVCEKEKDKCKRLPPGILLNIIRLLLCLRQKPSCNSRLLNPA